jgi:hypothetical protein
VLCTVSLLFSFGLIVRPSLMIAVVVGRGLGYLSGRPMCPKKSKSRGSNVSGKNSSQSGQADC